MEYQPVKSLQIPAMIVALVMTLATSSVRIVIAQEVDCDTFPINLVVHANQIVEPPHQTPELLLESDNILLSPGMSTTAWVSVVSQLEPAVETAAVQGFTLSVAVEGNVEVTSATLDGTTSAPEPDGLVQPGTFAYTRVIDPDLIDPEADAPQGQGVIASVVYSFREAVTLIPTGTGNVLAIDLAAPETEEPSGRIVFRDGLRLGGADVTNAFTVNGESRYSGPEDNPLACAREAAIVAAEGNPFVRSDANGNGTIELSDGIFIHKYLFVGNPAELPCEDAADVNDDGELNIVDGVIVFMYLFIGGARPTPPFPACGFDATDDDPFECAKYDPCP